MPLIPPNVTTTIFLLKNGDIRRPPLKFVVNWLCYRSMEVLFNAITQKLNLFSAARRIYTTQGMLITNATELVMGESYVVCCGYETFKPMRYHEAGMSSITTSKGSQGSNQRIRGASDISSNVSKPEPKGDRKKVDAKKRYSALKKGRGAYQRRDAAESAAANESHHTPFFTPFMKAYRLMLFPNGDANHRGVLLTINYRNCRTWDQLMNEVSQALSFVPVPIRRLYNALSGQLVERWTDLFDGMNIVATGSEGLIWKDYRILAREDLDRMHRVHDNPALEKPSVITVYPNGDSYYMGFNVTVTEARFPTIEKLLHFINRHVDWSLTAAGKKLYRIPGGIRVRYISEIVAGGQYVVATDTDPFMDIEYNVKALLPIYKMFGYAGSAGIGQRNIGSYDNSINKYASEGDFNRGLRGNQNNRKTSTMSLGFQRNGDQRISTMNSLPAESDRITMNPDTVNQGSSGSNSGRATGKTSRKGSRKGNQMTRLGNGSSVSGPKFMPLPEQGFIGSKKTSVAASTSKDPTLSEVEESIPMDDTITRSMDKVFGPRNDLNLWLKEGVLDVKNGPGKTSKAGPVQKVGNGGKWSKQTANKKHSKYTDDSDDEGEVNNFRDTKPTYHHHAGKSEKRSDESLNEEDDLDETSSKRPNAPIPQKVSIPNPEKGKANEAVDLKKLLNPRKDAKETKLAVPEVKEEKKTTPVVPEVNDKKVSNIAKDQVNDKKVSNIATDQVNDKKVSNIAKDQVKETPSSAINPEATVDAIEEPKKQTKSGSRDELQSKPKSKKTDEDQMPEKSIKNELSTTTTTTTTTTTITPASSIPVTKKKSQDDLAPEHISDNVKKDKDLAVSSNSGSVKSLNAPKEPTNTVKPAQTGSNSYLNQDASAGLPFSATTAPAISSTPPPQAKDLALSGSKKSLHNSRSSLPNLVQQTVQDNISNSNNDNTNGIPQI